MFVKGEASMKRLSRCLTSIASFPEYLVPSAVLDLADRFVSSQGWGQERIFQAWALKQRFRQALPRVYECLGLQMISRNSRVSSV